MKMVDLQMQYKQITILCKKFMSSEEANSDFTNISQLKPCISRPLNYTVFKRLNIFVKHLKFSFYHVYNL